MQTVEKTFLISIKCGSYDQENYRGSVEAYAVSRK